MMNDPADFMAGIMGDSIPWLPGALCKGSTDGDHNAHDSTTEAKERAAKAIATCHRCPSLQPCHDWIESLPADRHRPTGVIGARVYGWRGAA